MLNSNAHLLRMFLTQSQLLHDQRFNIATLNRYKVLAPSCRKVDQPGHTTPVRIVGDKEQAVFTSGSGTNMLSPSIN